MICPGCGEIVSFSADDMGDISFDVRHLDDDRYAIGVYPASSDAGPFMSLITLHECRDDGKQADSPAVTPQPPSARAPGAAREPGES